MQCLATLISHVLNEYVSTYNESRAHQSFDGDAPEPRETETNGRVIARPVLGGLHHRYSRAG